MLSHSCYRVSPAGLRRPRSRANVQTQASAPGAASSRDSLNVLITGGNTGIGYKTAAALCRQGHAVTLACRDGAKSAAAAKALRDAVPSARVHAAPLDLSDLSSVRGCAQGLLDSGAAFDVIINNAGVMACPHMTTKDGFEYQMGVNHLGHFLLTWLLLPSLKAANRPTRIINVASEAHRFGRINFEDLNFERPGSYSPWPAYGASKLANILFTYELARRLQAEGHSQITVNCLHPGVVATELGRHMTQGMPPCLAVPAVAAARLFFKTPQQGAATSVHLATSAAAANVSAKYFKDCRPVASSWASYDARTAARLFDLSVELTRAG